MALSSMYNAWYPHQCHLPDFPSQDSGSEFGFKAISAICIPSCLNQLAEEERRMKHYEMVWKVSEGLSQGVSYRPGSYQGSIVAMLHQDYEPNSSVEEPEGNLVFIREHTVEHLELLRESIVGLITEWKKNISSEQME